MVFQSAWSFWMWKRVRRSAAAYAIARPSCSSSMPARTAASRASTTACGSSSRKRHPSAATLVVERASPSRHRPRAASSAVDRGVGERGEVVRMAPLRELLRALRLRGLPDERREHQRAGVGVEVVECFERLVREVDRVALVDEHVVRYGGEHHGFGVRESVRVDERRLEHTLGGVRRACLDEAAVPRASRSTGTPSLVSGPTGNRGARPRVSRATNTRPCTSASARSSGVEVGDEVRHRDERREPRAPAGLAVASAELHAGAHDRTRIDARVEEPEHRLRHDERDVLLETLAQATLQVADRDPFRTGATNTSSPRISTSKPRASSAQRSSVQPETRSKRAWCQWQVTSPASTVPWCSGKPRCGQRSSIAYARAVVPEHDDRQRADLRPELAGRSAGRPGFLLGASLAPSRGPLAYLRERILAIISCVMAAVKSDPPDAPGPANGRRHQAQDRRAPQARRRDAR